MTRGYFHRASMFALAFTNVLTCIPAPSQSTVSPAATTPNAVLQSAQAFSSGTAFHQVQLTGYATWHAGSLNDSGSVSLNANSDGSGQMQLQLAIKGSLSETFGAIGEDRTCLFSGGDGVRHSVDAITCWKPTLWFLPSVSFQVNSMPSGLAFNDRGVGPMGSGTYRHIVSSIAFANLSARLQTRVASECTVDVGLDPTTLLPSVLVYTAHPDNGSPAVISFKIEFADYRRINGVQVPFSIKRYINGSLQLALTITSANVN